MMMLVKKKLIFLGFFDLIHVCYMSYNIHTQFQPSGVRMCVVFAKILYFKMTVTKVSQ